MKGIILAGAITCIAGLFGLIGTVDEDVAKQNAQPPAQVSEKVESDKDISCVPMKVNGDPTGNMRVSVIAEDVEIQEYALEYYEKYFEKDNEIHGIVNFNYNTTTRIAKMGNLLDVSIHEYVKDEEHDAVKFLSGELLKEYHVNIDTGEIEEVL